MKSLQANLDDERLLTRYLLGELAEEERERLEAAYFSDDRVFAQLLAAEDELVDSYVADELTNDERVRFEERFLSTAEGCRRVEFARRLKGAADEYERRQVTSVAGEPETAMPTPPARPERRVAWWQSIAAWMQSLTPAHAALAFAALALVAVASGIVWFSVQRGGDPPTQTAQHQGVPEPRQTQYPSVEPSTNAQMDMTQRQQQRSPDRSADNTSRPAITQEQTAATTVPPSRGNGVANRAARRPATQARSSVLASVLLTAGMVRGAEGEANQLVIPPAAAANSQARLRLGVESADYTRYSAVVQTAGGVEVFRARSLRAQPTAAGRFVDVRVPIRLLTARDYVVLLSGEASGGTAESVGGYSFRVTRR